MMNVVTVCMSECVCMHSMEGGEQLASLGDDWAGLQPPFCLSRDLVPVRLESCQGTLVSPDFKPPTDLLAVVVLVETLLVLPGNVNVQVERFDNSLDKTGSQVPGCSKQLANSFSQTS